MGAVSMPLEHISASESEPFLDSREHESLVVRSNPYGIAPQRIRLLPIPLDRIRQVNCIRLQLTAVLGIDRAKQHRCRWCRFCIHDRRDFACLLPPSSGNSGVFLARLHRYALYQRYHGWRAAGIFAAIIVKTLYKPETRVDRFITSIL